MHICIIQFDLEKFFQKLNVRGVIWTKGTAVLIREIRLIKLTTV